VRPMQALLRAAISCCLLATAAAAPPADTPSWPTRDWPSSSPEAQGVDSAALARLVDFGASVDDRKRAVKSVG